jgi:hypothetical protein
MLWLRSLKWYHRWWCSMAWKRKDQWLMLQVHQCVAVVEGGFDAVAEERHRMCSIDPRTQPVLILRQSSFQIVPVVVCLLAAYSRVGLWFFFVFSFHVISFATSILHIQLHCVINGSCCYLYLVTNFKILVSVLRCLEGIECLHRLQSTGVNINMNSTYFSCKFYVCLYGNCKFSKENLEF